MAIKLHIPADAVKQSGNEQENGSQLSNSFGCILCWMQLSGARRFDDDESEEDDEYDCFHFLDESLGFSLTPSQGYFSAVNLSMLTIVNSWTVSIPSL